MRPGLAIKYPSLLKALIRQHLKADRDPSQAKLRAFTYHAMLAWDSDFDFQ